MSVLDSSVVIVSLGLCFLYALRSGFPSRGPSQSSLSEDYLLAIFIDGVSGWVMQGWYWYLVYLIFVIFFVGKIQRSDERTLPGLLSQVHGPSIRPIVAIYTYINVVPIAYLVSIGWVAQQVLGMSPILAIIITTAFIVVYSWRGGFSAILRTDMIQTILMYVSIAIVLWFCLRARGLIATLSVLPKTHLAMSGKSSSLEMLSWFLIALSSLVDPNFYQRCFAAKSARQARIGVLMAIGCWFVFDLCVTLISLYARALFPDAAPQAAYLTLVRALIPSGFYGLIISGLVATIMSTIDSYLFVGAMTLSEDLSINNVLESNRKQAYVQGCENPNRRTRIGLLVSALVAVIFSSVYKGRIKSLWKTLGGLSTAGVLVPGVAAFTPWSSESAAKASLLAGGLSFLGLQLYPFRSTESFNVFFGREPLVTSLGISIIIYFVVYVFLKQSNK